MAYDLYINGVLFPVTPSKVQVKNKNSNKTTDLINDGEVNIVKTPGLKEISFDLLLPNYKYKFANYSDGFRKAAYYVDVLQELKDNGSKFQFILSRNSPQGNNFYNTDMTVTMEDLNITDDTKQGMDVQAAVKLKEWRDYGTKTFTIATNVIAENTQRTPSADEPTAGAGGSSYTVKKGDCLWKIAKQFYGNGADYSKIVNANSDKISNPNLIYPGQVLTIPS